MTTDAITDQFDYFLKITKLIEDEKRKHSLLTKTMKDLLDAIANNHGQLQHIETWFWDLVESDQKRQLLVNCAIDGFQKAGVFDLLADGKFTLDQLVKKAPNARTTGGQGVYVRIYLAERGLMRNEEAELSEKLDSLSGEGKSTAERRKLLA